MFCKERKQNVCYLRLAVGQLFSHANCVSSLLMT